MVAPVIVFGYKRFEHLFHVLNSLNMCDLADQTDLYIFLDGPKNDFETKEIHELWSKIENVTMELKFKNISIVKNKKNNGLARSIIRGVTDVINKYNKVIVLEDDSVPNKQFLKYMNFCLDYYENKDFVGHIAAYTIPIKFPSYFEEEVFLSSRGSSYAWGTWKAIWGALDWEIKEYKKFRFSFRKRNIFNKSGNDRSIMLDEQMFGKIDSWAIRFSFNMFTRNLKAVVPRYSLVKNIGHDGTGTHSAFSNKYDVSTDNMLNLDNLKNASFDKKIEKQYKKFFRVPFFKRLLKFIYYNFLFIHKKGKGKKR